MKFKVGDLVELFTDEREGNTDYCIILECIRNMSMKNDVITNDPKYLVHFLSDGDELIYREFNLRKLDD